MNIHFQSLYSAKHLPRYEPLAPRKIFYINRTTSLDLMLELINRVKQTNQFLFITKYDHRFINPALIQILFSKGFKTYIVLIEVGYLPRDHGSMLFQKIQFLLSIILCPINFIQSWGHIKMELKHFLVYRLFSIQQIEQIQAINIQQKFHRWFDKIFDHTDECYELYDDMIDNSYCICFHRPFRHTYDEWSLQMAIVFTFQLYFDTSLTDHNWNIGLYLQFDIPSTTTEAWNNLSDSQIQYEKQRRFILSQYAVQECLAIHKLTALLQNAYIRRQTEEYLKNYYLH